MRNKILNIAFIVVLLVAVFISYGVGYNSFKVVNKVPTDSTSKLSNNKYIGEDKAKELVLTHAKLNEADIREYEVDLDIEHNKVIYEISFESGDYDYEYEVNAITSEIVSDYKELDKVITTTKKVTTTKKKTTTSAYKVSKSKAKDIAIKHAGVKSSEIRDYDIELDYERGKYIYEMDFEVGKTEYSYDIDANTGKIIKSEKDIED